MPKKQRPNHDPSSSRQPKPHPVRAPKQPPKYPTVKPVVSIPRDRRSRPIVQLFLLVGWLLGVPTFAQPGDEWSQVLQQLQEEGQWVREELRSVESERRELEEQLASAPSSTPERIVAPAPEPMRRSETTARLDIEPPRFEGRSVIQEVAYALDEAVIECVAFRVCVIFLEPGERIVDRNLGDVDRWNYREGYAGPAGVETPAITVQPLGWDLETNLVLFTDRRVYRVTLRGLSKPKKGSTVEFTEVLHFRYPQQAMRIAEPPPRPSATGPSSAVGPSLGALNFGYGVETPRKRRERFRWEPTAIFDDGERIFVYLPERAFLDEAPLLVGLDGEDEPVQVNPELIRDERTGRRYFEVPRLIGSLELFAGQGRSRRWLRIHRREGG